MLKLRFIIRVLTSIIFIGALSSAGYFYYRYQQIRGATGEADAQHLKAMVSEIMELPEEEPTVATVTDPGKLSSQPFFLKSQTGDKVLIFANTKKAILYRPSINKIIDVSSIQSTPSVSPEPSVAVSPSSTPKPSSEPKN